MSGYLQYLRYGYQTLLSESLSHVLIVVAAMLVSFVVAAMLGLLAYRRAWLAEPLLSITSTALTLPSLALFGLMIPIFGLGFVPTLIVLVIYAVMPILRNLITGLNSISPAILEAATGIGMTRTRRLFVVEVPLAWPIIVTGLRFSSMMVVGVAAVGAYVGGPGLGATLFNGLAEVGSRSAVPEVLSATIMILLIAIALDGIFWLISRITVSPGIR
ncbi:MAG: ABC transporter permease [Acidimicrobiaceae bacterium]|nr:ABC transporter permease [Acidimicrobiaceae bacterium]